MKIYRIILPDLVREASADDQFDFIKRKLSDGREFDYKYMNELKEIYIIDKAKFGSGFYNAGGIRFFNGNVFITSGWKVGIRICIFTHLFWPSIFLVMIRSFTFQLGWVFALVVVLYFLVFSIADYIDLSYFLKRRLNLC